MSRLLFIAALALVSATAQSAPIAYTNRVEFLTALSGLTTHTLDFDLTDAGSLIGNGNALDGITFHYDELASYSVSMQVRNDNLTTSGTNYLGTTDYGVFMDGDDFDLSFANSFAIGMTFITAGEMLNGDITLTAGNTSVGLVAAAGVPLDDDSVYFLGIIDTAAAFTTASVTAFGGAGGPWFVYNVDDIVTANLYASPNPAPVPASLALILAGLSPLGWQLRHRRHT
ncbi:hypothetical protein [Chromatium okenii]|jgi:hypothetical protein|uniref:PEP-CTERM sorting domain-containing protein n=1 Tax=Chromatium okenii TaxID=61644 RepID=A0A2S7XSG9_9GAMM|nr:hypothetical protein [Chromatium okenii]MBV5310869.1 hypothetical protein [Chromatium okenii]PQJ96362.1 hypothetical protein CXB77_11585 [Chromatium okenii]